MDVATRPERISAEDFARHPDRKFFELVDGELVPTKSGALAGWLGGELLCALMEHCEQSRLGWVFPAGTAYQCYPGRPDLVRKPDVSFVPFGCFPNERLPRGYICIAPALAVEVVAPDEMFEDVEIKVAEYRSAGVRLIWVVNPSTRTVLIRRLDGTAAVVGPDGELSGEDVVPGFRCRVADLFRPPAGVPGPA